MKMLIKYIVNEARVRLNWLCRDCITRMVMRHGYAEEMQKRLFQSQEWHEQERLDLEAQYKTSKEVEAVTGVPCKLKVVGTPEYRDKVIPWVVKNMWI